MGIKTVKNKYLVIYKDCIILMYASEYTTKCMEVTMTIAKTRIKSNPINLLFFHFNTY